MKTNVKITLTLLLISIALLLIFGKFKFTFYGNQTCKPIYVQDYNFICCVKEQIPSQISSQVFGNFLGVNIYAPIKCPTEAVECIYNGFISAIVYQECHKEKSLLGGENWVCSNLVQSGTNLVLKPGQWIWDASTQHTDQLKIDVYNKKLVDCGKAGCTQGISITGATGCTFQTNLKVYDSKGNLIGNENPQATLSYTVPYGECYLYTTDAMRHIAGDTCEYCKSDEDCIEGRQYKYYYNGKWYGADATTSTKLNLYGCKKYENKCVNKDVLPGIGEKCLAYAVDSRCELIKTIDVQCVPGSSACGSNGFCDPETFTCKQTLSCRYDWECGVQEICDYTTKKIKIPKCELGKCVFEEKPVECCYDVNCPSGYMCDADKKCKQMTHPKTACPYECCVNDPDYFDKPCKDNVPCIEHTCTYYEKCNKNGICDKDLGETPKNCPSDCREVNWNYLWAILAGLLSFLILGENDIRKKDYIGISISLIIAIVIGFATFWILENLMKILLGGILGLALGGIAMWLFGPIILAFISLIVSIIKAIKE